MFTGTGAIASSRPLGRSVFPDPCRGIRYPRHWCRWFNSVRQFDPILSRFEEGRSGVRIVYASVGGVDALSGGRSETLYIMGHDGLQFQKHSTKLHEAPAVPRQCTHLAAVVLLGLNGSTNRWRLYPLCFTREMPANLTTLPHLSVSSVMNLTKFEGRARKHDACELIRVGAGQPRSAGRELIAPAHRVFSTATGVDASLELSPPSVRDARNS